MTFEDDDFLYDGQEDNYEVIYEDILKRVKNALAISNFTYIDSEELYNTADHYFITGDYQNSLTITNYALEIYESNTDFMLLKAEILTQLESINEALFILNEIEEREPYNTHIYSIRAGVYKSKNQYELVKEEYLRALELPIDEPEIIYEEMGHLLSFEEKFNEASQYYIKCLEANPENLNVFNALTDLYIDELGAMDGLSYLEDFTNDFPDSIYAWYSAGRIFESQEMFQKAIKAYEKALRIDKNFFNAIENVIRCLKETFDHKRILQICSHYKDFMFPFFYIEAAETYFETDNIEEATRYFFKVLEKDSDNYDAITGITRCYIFDGKYNKAMVFIDKAIKNNPYFEDLKFYKGILQKNNGEHQKAIETFLSALLNKDEFFDTSDIYFELADSYCQLNDFNTAIVKLLEYFNENNIFISPKNLLLLAACYYNIGDKEKAYSYFEDGLRIDNKLWQLFYDKCEKSHNDMLILDLINKYDG